MKHESRAFFGDRFAPRVNSPGERFNRPCQRRVRAGLPQILHAQLHFLEHSIVAREPGKTTHPHRSHDCLFGHYVVRIELIENEAGLVQAQAETPEQFAETPRPMSRNQRLIDDIEEFIAAFPCRYRVLIDVVATVDDDEVEQLTHEIEHHADRNVGNAFGVLKPPGRRQQVNP